MVKKIVCVCVCCDRCSKFRAETDLEHMQNERKRLSCQLQQRERDLMQSQLREKQMSRTNKILTGKLKMEKDEVLYLSPLSCFLVAPQAMTKKMSGRTEKVTLVKAFLQAGLTDLDEICHDGRS